MTHVEQISTLPADQQRAARELERHADERTVAEAVHAGVPGGIASYLSGMSVERLHTVAEAVDERDRALDAQL